MAGQNKLPIKLLNGDNIIKTETNYGQNLSILDFRAEKQKGKIFWPARSGI